MRTDQQRKESWRPVVGYEGLYEVSDKGRVKSFLKIKNRILKPVNDNYLRVDLYKNGKNNLKLIHRLVAEAFIKNPNTKPQVNHIDGNKHNNTIENLEWVTAKENGKHAYNVLNNKVSWAGKKGKECHSSKKVKQLNLDGEKVKVWDSVSDAHRAGYEGSCISRCCSGVNKTHKGYRWEYAS